MQESVYFKPMRSLVRFTKMHGAGNDFVVVDGVSQHLHITPNLVRQLSDRNTGVGFDQFLLLEPPTRTDVDFSYRIFNPDGKEAEQCGNGARCIARFAHDAGLAAPGKIVMETLSGLVEMQIQKGGMVKVNMGQPSFFHKDIPTTLRPQNNIFYNLGVETIPTQAMLVSVGNPHCIITVPKLDTQQLETWAQAIETTNAFPVGVNVSIVQNLARNHIKLAVYERGAGLTQACGSAACAAVVALIKSGEVSNTVQVDMPGGHVSVNWANEDAPIMLTGPTASVFRGHFVVNHE